MNANDVKALRDKTGAGFSDCKKALEETSGDMEKAIDWLREKGISKAAKKESRIAAEGLCNILVEGNNAVITEVNSETDFVAKNSEFKDLCTLITKNILTSDVTDYESVLNVSTEEGTIRDIITNLVAKIGEKLSFRRFEKVIKNDNENFGAYLHMGGKIGVLVLLEGANPEVARDVAMHIAAMNPQYITRDEVTNDVLEREKNIIKEQAINEGKQADIAEKMVAGRISKFYKEVCLNEQPFVKNGDITVETYVKDNNGKVVKMIRFEVGEGIEKRCENFADEVMKQIKE